MAETAPSIELNIGSVVAGTYKITGLLGKGGMGVVWAADHERLPGKRVAIKVLHAEVAKDTEALLRFRREAEITSRLGHQNIVDVLDFNTLPDGTPYLVLEYLQGESLATRLLRGPMAFDEVCRFVRQIGSALDAAHAQNIIHRDLKPQNVFLCPRETAGVATEEAKVLDFGISKIRGSNTVKTQDHTLLGTPQYMAPEQATGDHDAVDGRTDVFAFGAMVYEMLSGEPAFGGQTIPEVVFKVVYESPRDLRELVPTITPEAAAAVHKALEKKREDRFDGVSGFVLALTGTPITTLRGSVVSSGDAVAEGTAATMATPASQKLVDVGMGMAPTQTGNPLALMANQGVAGTGAGAVAADQTVPASLPEGDKQPRKGSRRALTLTLAGLLSLSAIVVFLVTRPGGGGGDTNDDRATTSKGMAGTKTDTDTNVVSKNDPDRVVAGQKDAKREGGAGTTPKVKPKVVKSDDVDKPSTHPARKNHPVKKNAKPKKRRATNPTGAFIPTRTPKNRRRSNKINPRAAEMLNKATAALNGGNTALARYLADRAMNFGGKMSAAYAIIAKSYCKQQNLGMAKANLRNVHGRFRRKVKAYCKRQGVELVD